MAIFPVNPERRDPGFLRNKGDFGLNNVDNLSATDFINMVAEEVKAIGNHKLETGKIVGTGPRYVGLLKTSPLSTHASFATGLFKHWEDCTGDDDPYKELSQFYVNFSFSTPDRTDDGELGYIVMVPENDIYLRDCELIFTQVEDVVYVTLYVQDPPQKGSDNFFNVVKSNLIEWTEGTVLLDSYDDYSDIIRGHKELWRIKLDVSRSSIESDYCDALPVYDKRTGRRVKVYAKNYLWSDMENLDYPTINGVPFIAKKGMEIGGVEGGRNITVTAFHDGPKREDAGGHDWEVLNDIRVIDYSSRNVNVTTYFDPAKTTSLTNDDALGYGLCRPSKYATIPGTCESYEEGITKLRKWLNSSIGDTKDVVTVGMLRIFGEFLMSQILGNIDQDQIWIDKEYSVWKIDFLSDRYPTVPWEGGTYVLQINVYRIVTSKTMKGDTVIDISDSIEYASDSQITVRSRNGLTVNKVSEKTWSLVIPKNEGSEDERTLDYEINIDGMSEGFSVRQLERPAYVKEVKYRFNSYSTETSISASGGSYNFKFDITEETVYSNGTSEQTSYSNPLNEISINNGASISFVGPGIYSITYPENKNTDSSVKYTLTFSLPDGKDTKTISITQSAADVTDVIISSGYNFSFSKTIIPVGSTGVTMESVNISSYYYERHTINPNKYTCTPIDVTSYPEWCSVSITDLKSDNEELESEGIFTHTIYVDVKENESEQTRYGTITVTQPDNPSFSLVQISVEQAGKSPEDKLSYSQYTLIVDQPSINIGYSGQKQNIITVTSFLTNVWSLSGTQIIPVDVDINGGGNVDGFILNYNFSGIQSNSNKGTITFDVDANNDRESDRTHTFTIVQRADPSAQEGITPGRQSVSITQSRNGSEYETNRRYEFSKFSDEYEILVSPDGETKNVSLNSYLEISYNTLRTEKDPKSVSVSSKPDWIDVTVSENKTQSGLFDVKFIVKARGTSPSDYEKGNYRSDTVKFKQEGSDKEVSYKISQNPRENVVKDYKWRSETFYFANTSDILTSGGSRTLYTSFRKINIMSDGTEEETSEIYQGNNIKIQKEVINWSGDESTKELAEGIKIGNIDEKTGQCTVEFPNLGENGNTATYRFKATYFNASSTEITLTQGVKVISRAYTFDVVGGTNVRVPNTESKLNLSLHSYVTITYEGGTTAVNSVDYNWPSLPAEISSTVSKVLGKGDSAGSLSFTVEKNLDNQKSFVLSLTQDESRKSLNITFTQESGSIQYAIQIDGTNVLHTEEFSVKIDSGGTTRKDLSIYPIYNENNSGWTKDNSSRITVSEEHSWIQTTTFNTSENSLSFSVTENMYYTQRSGVITVKYAHDGGTTVANIKVTQFPVDPNITVDNGGTVTLTKGDTYAIFEVDSTHPYTISEVPDEIKLQGSSKKNAGKSRVAFTVPVNDGSSEKQYRITLAQEGTDQSAYLNINQSVSSDYINIFGYTGVWGDVQVSLINGASVVLPVESNVDYFVSHKSDWLKVKISSGSDYTYNVRDIDLDLIGNNTGIDRLYIESTKDGIDATGVITLSKYDRKEARIEVLRTIYVVNTTQSAINSAFGTNPFNVYTIAPRYQYVSGSSSLSFTAYAYTTQANNRLTISSTSTSVQTSGVTQITQGSEYYTGYGYLYKISFLVNKNSKAAWTEIPYSVAPATSSGSGLSSNVANFRICQGPNPKSTIVTEQNISVRAEGQTGVQILRQQPDSSGLLVVNSDTVPGWISFSGDYGTVKGTITLDIAPNTGSTQRSATIQIYEDYPDTVKTFTITQVGGATDKTGPKYNNSILLAGSSSNYMYVYNAKSVTTTTNRRTFSTFSNGYDSSLDSKFNVTIETVDREDGVYKITYKVAVKNTSPRIDYFYRIVVTSKTNQESYIYIKSERSKSIDIGVTGLTTPYYSNNITITPSITTSGIGLYESTVGSSYDATQTLIPASSTIYNKSLTLKNPKKLFQAAQIMDKLVLRTSEDYIGYYREFPIVMSAFTSLRYGIEIKEGDTYANATELESLNSVVTSKDIKFSFKYNDTGYHTFFIKSYYPVTIKSTGTGLSCLTLSDPLTDKIGSINAFRASIRAVGENTSTTSSRSLGSVTISGTGISISRTLVFSQEAMPLTEVPGSNQIKSIDVSSSGDISKRGGFGATVSTDKKSAVLCFMEKDCPSSFGIKLESTERYAMLFRTSATGPTFTQVTGTPSGNNYESSFTLKTSSFVANESFIMTEVAKYSCVSSNKSKEEGGSLTSSLNSSSVDGELTVYSRPKYPTLTLMDPDTNGKISGVSGYEFKNATSSTSKVSFRLKVQSNYIKYGLAAKGSRITMTPNNSSSSREVTLSTGLEVFRDLFNLKIDFKTTGSVSESNITMTWDIESSADDSVILIVTATTSETVDFTGGTITASISDFLVDGKYYSRGDTTTETCGFVVAVNNNNNTYLGNPTQSEFRLLNDNTLYLFYNKKSVTNNLTWTIPIYHEKNYWMILNNGSYTPTFVGNGNTYSYSATYTGSGNSGENASTTGLVSKDGINYKRSTVTIKSATASSDWYPNQTFGFRSMSQMRLVTSSSKTDIASMTGGSDINVIIRPQTPDLSLESTDGNLIINSSGVKGDGKVVVENSFPEKGSDFTVRFRLKSNYLTIGKKSNGSTVTFKDKDGREKTVTISSLGYEVFSELLGKVKLTYRIKGKNTPETESYDLEDLLGKRYSALIGGTSNNPYIDCSFRVTKNDTVESFDISFTLSDLLIKNNGEYLYENEGDDANVTLTGIKVPYDTTDVIFVKDSWLSYKEEEVYMINDRVLSYTTTVKDQDDFMAEILHSGRYWKIGAVSSPNNPLIITDYDFGDPGESGESTDIVLSKNYLDYKQSRIALRIDGISGNLELARRSRDYIQEFVILSSDTKSDLDINNWADFKNRAVLIVCFKADAPELSIKDLFAEYIDDRRVGHISFNLYSNYLVFGETMSKSGESVTSKYRKSYLNNELIGPHELSPGGYDIFLNLCSSVNITLTHPASVSTYDTYLNLNNLTSAMNGNWGGTGIASRSTIKFIQTSVSGPCHLKFDLYVDQLDWFNSVAVTAELNDYCSQVIDDVVGLSPFFARNMREPVVAVAIYPE